MRKSFLSKGILSLFAMCVGLTVVSCSKEADDVVPSLSVEVDSLLLAQDGSSQSLKITSSTDWVITGNPEWLAVNHIYGSGNKTVVLTPSVNEGYTVRRCVLTIALENGESSSRVVVEQAASSLLGLSEVIFTLGGIKGSESALKITTNSEWSITDVPEWLTLSQTSGKGSAMVVLTTNSMNYSLDARECVLQLVAGSESTILLVAQEAVLSEACSTEIFNKIILHDGFYADLAFGTDAYRYKEMILYAEDFKTHSEEDIWNMVIGQEYSYRTTTYDYTIWNLEDADTEYVYCAVAFDYDFEGDTVFGPLATKHFKTKSAESNCDAPIGEITYTDDYGEESWKVSFTMEEECQYYYLLYSTEEYADTYNEKYTNIDLAYAIYDRKENYFYFSPYYEPYEAVWDRSGEDLLSEPETRLCAWTWGVDLNGEYSSCISKKYINIEENNATEVPQRVATKKDRVKLTREELNEKVSRLKISTNRVGM